MSKKHELLESRIGIPTCVCGSDDFKLRERKGEGVVHIGLHCASCGTWIKWVGKSSIRSMAKVEADKTPKQDSLW
jgi:hypothetical protein